MLLLGLAALSMNLNTAQAQQWDANLRASKITYNSFRVSWDPPPNNVTSDVYRRSGESNVSLGRANNGFSFHVKGLQPGTRHVITVKNQYGEAELTVSTRRRFSNFAYVSPARTCPVLPSNIVVSGYSEYTQCQTIDQGGVGQMDVLDRGFIAGVDIWHSVAAGVEVCISGNGWLVFLDADYSPRMVMEMEHTHRAGMTCGEIDREGSVVLVARAAPEATAAPEASTRTHHGSQVLPVFESIPLVGCHIKLVETLFLRSEPGGEIIGLIWLNSEVPAFEINGYWYKVEFEGKTGYISRYHRKVLRGGCG